MDHSKGCLLALSNGWMLDILTKMFAWKQTLGMHPQRNISYSLQPLEPSRHDRFVCLLLILNTCEREFGMPHVYTPGGSALQPCTM